MSSMAFVFPGQGSQFVGMGRDLVDLPRAQGVLATADQLLGFSLTQLMINGPKETLDDTLNTQPALFTLSVAIYECLPNPTAAFVAGHSLGEYAALYSAGVFSFADGLHLVRERGRLMKQAGAANPGGMAAIIGLDDATISAICASAGGVQVANYNSPGQVVISGTKSGVAAAMQAAKDRRARLVRALDVSIAAHSELMQPIVTEFAEAVRATPMRAPAVPIIANLTAAPLVDVESVRKELIGQLTGSVRWTQTVEFMAACGVNTFVEIGPGDVLTGLIRRIVKDAKLIKVNDIAGVMAYAESAAMAG
ncbi:MAG: ACP S-malonyltransferase [Chloroflexi bacterium]|nr:ACP S-malonyltransferase [Chloroflexota bacterium]